MSEKIVVFDTTLRDGEQSAGVCFRPRDKLEIAAALAAMDVDVIEADGTRPLRTSHRFSLTTAETVSLPAFEPERGFLPFSTSPTGSLFAFGHRGVYDAGGATGAKLGRPVYGREGVC